MDPQAPEAALGELSMAKGTDLELELDLARRLAAIAAAVALPFFGTELRHDVKHDGSPVTEADLAVERALFEILAIERPHDDVLSEEGVAASPTGAARRWIIDPIDGTVQFLARDPAWGTHIALEVDDEVVVGVITRPVDDRVWWAARGLGAWTSTGHRLQVSDAAEVATARVGGYMRPDSRWQADVARRTRWVESASPILELIEGRLDVVLSEGGFEWDHAPAVVLVEEAGGRFTDPRGGSRIDRRGGLYTNGALHEPFERSRPTRDL